MGSETTTPMKLLIAIPAYNEEANIKAIIERSLAAQKTIINNSPVTEVDITVVSDGSTDRTVELAMQYADQIKLVVFEKNKGYGAAIKEAWSQSDAELLGFLDADGTCDPNFFSQLSNTLENEGADIVLGCRLNSDSKMPLIRKLGNVIFAVMLTVFSSRIVRDTASGMRVIRRSCLPKLMPLPDGLHFTPAMSARAILSNDLKIIEIDMPYHERKGESKLRIGKDGFRFLKIITETAFLQRPSRLLAILGFLCLMVPLGLMINPTIYYIDNRAVAEWMIYRFIVSSLMGTCACLLFCTGYLSTKIVDIAFFDPLKAVKNRSPIRMFFSSPFFWLLPVLLTLSGGALVLRSFFMLVATGATYEHWSRFIAMSFLLSIALILIVTRLVDYILVLISNRLDYLRNQQI